MALEKDHYTYRVIWSEEDGEYAGLCAEFPSLSWLAETPEEAFNGIREVVAEIIADMETTGEEIPEPLSCRQYSGKFEIQVTPEVHRNLAIEAAEAGISLDRLVSEKLLSRIEA
ncbi:MAG: toxin-antitoxin system HicB family antitoxin [Desulfobacterales bacterium]|nr:toxin-antitoxin system HicB family antitoxin [Desulfobacterales bacterium]